MKPQRQVRNKVAVLLYEKELREKRRVTQQELAKFISVSENTITHWMYNNVTIFDAKSLRAYAPFSAVVCAMSCTSRRYPTRNADRIQHLDIHVAG